MFRPQVGHHQANTERITKTLPNICKLPQDPQRRHEPAS